MPVDPLPSSEPYHNVGPAHGVTWNPLLQTRHSQTTELVDGFFAHQQFQRDPNSLAPKVQLYQQFIHPDRVNTFVEGFERTKAMVTLHIDDGGNGDDSDGLVGRWPPGSQYLRPTWKRNEGGWLLRDSDNNLILRDEIQFKSSGARRTESEILSNFAPWSSYHFWVNGNGDVYQMIPVRLGAYSIRSVPQSTNVPGYAKDINEQWRPKWAYDPEVRRQGINFPIQPVLRRLEPNSSGIHICMRGKVANDNDFVGGFTSRDSGFALQPADQSVACIMASLMLTGHLRYPLVYAHSGFSPNRNNTPDGNVYGHWQLQPGDRSDPGIDYPVETITQMANLLFSIGVKGTQNLEAAIKTRTIARGQMLTLATGEELPSQPSDTQTVDPQVGEPDSAYSANTGAVDLHVNVEGIYVKSSDVNSGADNRETERVQQGEDSTAATSPIISKDVDPVTLRQRLVDANTETSVTLPEVASGIQVYSVSQGNTAPLTQNGLQEVTTTSRDAVRGIDKDISCPPGYILVKRD